MEMSDKALQIVTEGFEEVRKNHNEIKKDINFISQRLFGDPEKKVESLIEEVKSNKDRSHDNQRTINKIHPQHDEMFTFYTKIKGIILGYTVVSIVVGGVIWKGIGFLLSKI